MIYDPYPIMNQITLHPTIVYLMSGGKSSTLACYYHRQKYPYLEYIYYFNDTLIEHETTYGFLVRSLYFLEGLDTPSKVITLLENIPEINVHDLYLVKRRKHLDKLFTIVCRDTNLRRERSVDPYTSFEMDRYIGNSRVDVCSRMLKREPRLRFTNTVHNAEICVGFNWDESDRFDKALTFESNMIAPLITDFVDHNVLWDEFSDKSGICPGGAYDIGFTHDNCSGACVKAGLAHWKKLYEHRPNVYLWAETRMELAIADNPKLKPFLKKQVNGETLYLTLKAYRTQYLESNTIIEDDYIDCGACALLP